MVDPDETSSNDGPPTGTSALIERVREKGGACFVSDVRSSLDMTDEEFEGALASLVTAGRVVVQHNFCADPHFMDDDLRAVALVDAGCADPRGTAAAACERLWQRWMASFLASHRCT